MKKQTLVTKSLAVLVFSLMTTSAFAWQSDQWHGDDKVQHVEASFVAGLASSAFLAEVFPEHAHFVETFALALVPGMIREAAKPVPSYKDFTADIIGAAAGAYLGVKFIAIPLVNHNNKVDGMKVAYQTSFN